MRRLSVAACALALAFMGFAAAPVQATVPGYDSQYFGESNFLTLGFGMSGQFSAIFTNTGTTAWQKNTLSQVNLAVCLADQQTCNVPSPNASFSDGWLSNVAYSTTTADVVAPGQNAFFVYSVKVPSTAVAGTYRFHGDLVHASTGQRIHAQGYFQDVTVNVVSTDTTPPTSVTFFGGYPSQSGSTIVTKGQAWDIGGGVASVQVKIQRLDAGVLTDATAYSSATPDDGTFSSPVESFSHTTGLLSFPNGTPVQVSVKVTDTSGNVNTFTGPLVGNNGAWSTSPVNSSDTVPPTLAVTGCVDPLTGAVAGGCGVNTSETTPSGANSVIFSAFASDDVAVAGAEYAVTKPTSGDTVIGWSPCVAADGAFGGKLETVSCTVTFPSAATPAGGTSYVILVRAIDTGGNKSTPADPATGAFGGEFCTFFQSQYASGGGGASTTSNCVWRHDNTRPYVVATERSQGTIAPDMPLDQNSIIVIEFSESMRSISTTNRQAITVTDGPRIITLTSGINATFNRCFVGVNISTPGLCASTSDGGAGMGTTWQVIPNASTGLIFPLTLVSVANFRDYAGNTVDVARGDTRID